MVRLFGPVPEKFAQRSIKSRWANEMGRPDLVHRSPLPEGCFVVPWGHPEVVSSQYDATLSTDAAYDYDTHRRGLGWILERTNGDVVREGLEDYRGRGAPSAEISALIGGLLRAREEECRRVLVRTDNRLASHVLAGVNIPRQPHIVALANSMWSLLPHFANVAVAWVREKGNREADRLTRITTTPGQGRPEAQRLGTRTHFLMRSSVRPVQKGRHRDPFDEWMYGEMEFP